MNNQDQVQNPDAPMPKALKSPDAHTSPEQIQKTFVRRTFTAAVVFGVAVPLVLHAYFEAELGLAMFAGMGCFMLSLVVTYVLRASSIQEGLIRTSVKEEEMPEGLAKDEAGAVITRASRR